MLPLLPLVAAAVAPALAPALVPALAPALAVAPVRASAPAPVADSLMGPGISRALARDRAARLRAVSYELRLDVTRRDTATGHVVVRFERVRPGDVILDFRGLRLGAPVVNGKPVALARLGWNGAHLRIPAAALRAGRNSIALDFVSAIAPSGASIIRYHDVTDGNEYLYTLLVPADANQLFPCFDQPDLKARVRFTLTTPAGWRALANGAARSVDSTSRAGASTHAFRQTEPLSTYLIAFAAGPFATFHGGDAAHPITVYVRASRAKEVDADSLLAANARALRWLEGYFARPFPFQKFDMLLAPAFPFGGMEHPGAVFYNENSFIFRERPTLPQWLGRESTIYHEVAHQWFGDLVTMRWFDDLWLKEGFATYMAAKMQSELEPASGAWKTFYLRVKPPAYAVDATLGTVPVWQALANLDQAKSNYGPIVYNKAPAVLKQLEYLVGDTAFRDGLRDFLARHAYANATWRDLLTSVGRAAHRDLGSWGAEYFLRPGMPVLEAAAERRGDTLARLVLTQHPARAERSGPGPWPVRTELLLGYADRAPVRIPVELAGDSAVVRAAAGRAAPDFVFANAGDEAYALTLLDARSVRWLEGHIELVDDPFLRAMLWGALWDEVREARLDPARYVALVVRALPSEHDEQIVPSLLGRLARATVAYLPPAARDTLLPREEAALLAAVADTARPYGLRKPPLDAFVQVARTAGGLATLDSLLDRDSVAGAPLRAPTRWAIVTALLERGAPTAEARFAAEAARDTTSEGRRLAFVAGAARPTAETKREYFTRYFADSTLNEDWAMASLGAFDAVDQQALTLPYLVPALDSLPWIQRNRRIFFLGAWLGSTLGGQTSPEALDRVHRWLDAHPTLAEDLRAKVLQAEDELRRTVRIRAVATGAAAAGGRAAR